MPATRTPDSPLIDQPGLVDQPGQAVDGQPPQFGPGDVSIEAVNARAKAHAAQGYPEYDPLTMQRVWPRPTGRWKDGKQMYSLTLRPVTLDVEKGQREGIDYWSLKSNCWIRDGKKKEVDSDSYREDNVFFEQE